MRIFIYSVWPHWEEGQRELVTSGLHFRKDKTAWGQRRPTAKHPSESAVLQEFWDESSIGSCSLGSESPTLPQTWTWHTPLLPPRQLDTSWQIKGFTELRFKRLKLTCFPWNTRG